MDSQGRKFSLLEDNDNPYVLYLPKTTEGLLDGGKVSSAECVVVRFASHEAKDLKVGGKSMIQMALYMDWLLGTVAMLSQSGNMANQVKLQYILVLDGRCLAHMIQKSIMLYANFILKKHNPVLT